MRKVLITALALMGLPALAVAQSVDCAKPDCAAKLSPACLSRIGAGTLPAGDRCAIEQSEYLVCLRAVAQTCGDAGRTDAAGAGAPCSRSDAQQLYDDVKDSDDADELALFADTCPGTPQARLAAARAQRLRRNAQPIDLADPRTVQGRWIFTERRGVTGCFTEFEIKPNGDEYIVRSVTAFGSVSEHRAVANADKTRLTASDKEFRFANGQMTYETAVGACLYARR